MTGGADSKSDDDFVLTTHTHTYILTTVTPLSIHYYVTSGNVVNSGTLFC